MKLDDIFNNDTLNIFCDASIRKRGEFYDGCYGSIAVCKNDIIESIYRVTSNTTNNNAEIKAIKAGICLAIRHKNKFKQINIFSDSQISIFGIRDRISEWKYGQDGKLYGQSKQLIQSQEVYIEIMQLMIEHNLHVTFYHQKGHVSDTFESLKKATHVFNSSNRIRNEISYALIRYISDYNNIVDKKSRSVLYNTDIYTKNYRTPIIFHPVNFYTHLNQYNNMNCVGGKENDETK